MNVNIEKATLEDALVANKFLTKLINDEKKYDNNINDHCVVTSLYEKFYENDNVCLLVAKVNKEIVGYLYGFVFESGDSLIETVITLDALFVLEDYRKKGIAKKLIDEFKVWAIYKNAKFIELKVCDKNEAAINLYNKIGFNQTKIIMSLPLEDTHDTI